LSYVGAHLLNSNLACLDYTKTGRVRQVSVTQLAAGRESIRRWGKSQGIQKGSIINPALTPGETPGEQTSQSEVTAMRLGKYELHEVLGKGGFGVVYRATDLSLEREWRLKCSTRS